MVYNVIGLMSGSSLDGLDIAFVQFHATGGKWSMELLQATTYAYTPEWEEKLRNCTALSAADYLLLHSAYGHLTGQLVNRFIEAHGLEHKVHMIASHGHTSFHMPAAGMTAQLGDGAAIAAETGLPVISDLRAMDIAFGGQGAPIVPVGEKLLFGDYTFLLNLGGIANLSVHRNDRIIAFDSCAANRVLNMLAADAGLAFDENGKIAAAGTENAGLLEKLNQLPYYQLSYPKSLANAFGTDEVYPLIKRLELPLPDALHTYVKHIAAQIATDIARVAVKEGIDPAGKTLLVTGGGALNSFLVNCLQDQLADLQVNLVVPDRLLVEFKEAIIMALMGVLRWREEYTVLASVTGATRNSIGGALWLGNEA
ncbi:anhydro-N-acetylmuramic acid kinase [Flavihumibacter sp. CACIAM 22H1]|uniref:anhydro-N-acetylmuramic acid kinase n=1 Tax=Flavihumibacter sp. CACIAM 22H1 TaxID=1812911 RepID=UPI0007A86CA7|nr:anhydro-N-acetylmuramic acid kinase [Flavihumibacter sp. CACIAM 22H1]KYP16661.1 MAG: anhydro-N-acetylmuramic acid kinase [Flavihumibacter sp. CACIAM 22H1]